MSESAELVLEIKRALPAVRQVAFAAFSNADELAEWWGPEGFRTLGIDFVPRTGNGYRIEMQPPEGSGFHLSGRFREVDPPARLSFSFAWEDPDPDDVETVVDLALADRGEATEVGLTQGLFRTEARRALHRDGWTESFDKLERFLRSR
jgi:uncharacterized protein YndB with AHSA1/START domain